MVRQLAAGLSLLMGMTLGQAQSTEPPTARVIVKLRASVVAQGAGQAQVAAVSSSEVRSYRDRVHTLGTRLGLPVEYQRTIGRGVHVAMARGVRSEQLAARLAAQPDVEYAVVDQLRQVSSTTPNDPLFPAGQTSPSPPDGQWYLQSPTTQASSPSTDLFVAAVNAVSAWDVLSRGIRVDNSHPVVVAVVDTGVRLDHEDLAGKFLPGYNMISDATRAGNGTGRSADPSDLGDALSSGEISANSSVYSGCSVRATSTWHGTQVAGIIGAQTDNAMGVAGLAWGAKILPVRVMGKCGGYDSDIIAGMLWAVGQPVTGVPTNLNPAQVINLSLGASGACSAAYRDAVATVNGLGAVVVASAGNNDGQAVESPGNCPGVIAVAGLRHVGSKVGFSALGPEVAISAPGGNCVNTNTGSLCLYPIMTTSNSGATTPVLHADGGSIYTGGLSNASLGTSFSAPLVSATAALILAQRPTLQPAAVRQLLLSTARPFPASGGTSGIGQCQAPSSTLTQAECYCTTSTCGAGMLDAGLAMAAVMAKAVPVITVTPAQAVVGGAITLSGTASVASPAGTTVSYAWVLEDGGGIVSALTGDPSSSQVSATPSAAGTFKVRLTVQDDTGAATSNFTIQTIEVAAAPVPASSGGGGGGALETDTLWWLLTLGAVGAGWRRTCAGRRP